MVDKTPPQEMYKYLIERAIPESLEKIELTDYSRKILAKDFLYREYRRLGVLEWHLHGDVPLYKQHLKTALKYERERFTEAHQKDPTIWYYCPGEYARTALRTGDFAYAKSYSTFLDDHRDPTYEVRKPWEYYVLMHLLLGRYEEGFNKNMANLKKTYDTKIYEPIRPEYSLYEAIAEAHEEKFHKHLEHLARTHKPIARLFVDYEDRLLCLKGIALCNLALGRGMKVDFDHPFVPQALLGA